MALKNGNAGASGTQKWKSLLEKRKVGPFRLDMVDMVVLGILTACFVGIAIVGRFYGIVYVVGYSMAPTYNDGEILITDDRPAAEKLHIGSVVVFDSGEGHEYIKRVCGLPGQEVDIRGGVLYLDGEPQETEYPAMETGIEGGEPVILGENEYFVLGDNRNSSRDSRYIGPVRLDDITGIVLQGERKGHRPTDD